MRETNKYTIVVPTMWRFKPFINFLGALLNYNLVGEVILINNNIADTPEELNEIKSPKLTRIDFNSNIGVNPAWNLGTESARFPFVCILNDDVIFDLTLLNKLVPYLSDLETGVIGLSPGVSDFNQAPFVNGQINISQWNNEHTYGFGCLMFINKRNYIRIPEDMVYYFGDNFIFDTCLANKKKNYIITDILHYTPYAQTVGETGKGHLETEGAKYEGHIKNNKWALDIFHIEYAKAVDQETDIQKVIPKLYDYAMKCSSVLELGVRTGVSTRAFLNANLKYMTSVDLSEEYLVRDLFNVADIVGRDYKYVIADSREYEVDRDYDLLFIDTEHTYDQVSFELDKYHHFIRKYIIVHDVFKYGVKTDEEGDVGLLPAVLNFMRENPDWVIEEYTTDSNGLLVLKRRNE